MIDRNSFNDAKMTFEKLIADESKRYVFIDFLSLAIDFSNSLNSSNWNLNLDKDGQFVRLNVGHEYCIQIYKDELLIICDRLTLNPIIDKISIEIVYLGHIKKERVRSDKIDNVPDCLAKTKNSVGCIIKIKLISDNIKLLKQSNFDFIKQGIMTVMLPKMKEAHSKGAIEYLSYITKRQIPNPIYDLVNLPSLDNFLEKQQKDEQKARQLSKEQRQNFLINSDSKPTKTVTSQTVFNRNLYVVAEVLDRANGVCEKCKKTAPFLRDNDRTPYLEVHHIISLADNGDDTVENTIALCPNCHRQAHYGKKTY